MGATTMTNIFTQTKGVLVCWTFHLNIWCKLDLRPGEVSRSISLSRRDPKDVECHGTALPTGSDESFCDTNLIQLLYSNGFCLLRKSCFSLYHSFKTEFSKWVEASRPLEGGLSSPYLESTGLEQNPLLWAHPPHFHCLFASTSH